MTLKCECCMNFLKKLNPTDQKWIENSHVKINGKLHFAFGRDNPCITLKKYSPEVVIVAGDGAIELENGHKCWDILKDAMIKEKIVGPEGYHEASEGLTWLASYMAYMSRTHSKDDLLSTMKSRIIGELSKYSSAPRMMYCTCCDKHFKIKNSDKILVLTTNWELGLFKYFDNVIQLHGRCDHPQLAVLPSENVTRFMPKTLEELQALEGRLFPGSFLEKCLDNYKNLVFWGSGINDYDLHLWHFIYGFSCKKLNKLSKLQISIAAKDSEGFHEKLSQIEKYFPRISVNTCVCNMIPS